MQIEYVHSTYVKAQDGSYDDAIFVKEKKHNDQGEIQTNFRCIENYKRPLWITKKEFQNHKDFKEYEYMERLTKIETTQSNLFNSICMAVKGHRVQNAYDFATTTPYVYGTKPHITTILADEYKRRAPDASSYADLAVIDFETDVIHGTEQIIMGSVTFKGKVAFAGLKSCYPEGTSEETIKQACLKYLPKECGDVANFDYQIKLVDTNLDIVKHCLKFAHQWKPDIMGGWNLDFDIRKMLREIELRNQDPAFYFSDPSVPKKYKFCDWNPSEPYKYTAAGKKIPRAPSERWNVLTAPASFQFIDQMCYYRQHRNGAQSLNSYSLDNVMRIELNLTKLKFNGVASGEGTLEWHAQMQRHHPIMYSVYNIFDCIGCELLDAKTGDLSKTFFRGINCTPPAKFPSTPTKLNDKLHFRLLKEGKVSGSIRKGGLATELDEMLPRLGDWIDYSE